jgi:hypothetical protein
MSAKTVLVHRCSHASNGGPWPCSCRTKTTAGKAHLLVSGKRATWLGADFRQIVMKKKRPLGRPLLQKAQTIEAGHILRAVGAEKDCSERKSEYHRQRIDLYGQMNQQTLIDLLVVPKAERAI